ncbi:MAG: hypothetical protein ACLTAI_10135 [Thomasclavelia sp.]
MANIVEDANGLLCGTPALQELGAPRLGSICRGAILSLTLMSKQISHSSCNFRIASIPSK